MNEKPYDQKETDILSEDVWKEKVLSYSKVDIEKMTSSISNVVKC